MLTALAIALVVGLVALARGGSLHDLAETTFRWTPLLFAGLALQIVFGAWAPSWLDRRGALAVVLLSNLAVAVWLVVNRRLPGLLLAGAGMALNVLVIVSNGAMPVLDRSADAAGVSQSLDDAGLKHERLDDDTVLPWLGDAIPVPPTREVLSVGDVVLALGLAQLVDARMTAHKKGRHRAGKGSSPASG
ncbi:MAG: DUF5317 domain-containing protein [Actinomycetota bacterium]|nr:DUF5317 domain-containing protein [Actinomycetota bacterium]